MEGLWRVDIEMEHSLEAFMIVALRLVIFRSADNIDWKVYRNFLYNRRRRGV